MKECREEGREGWREKGRKKMKVWVPREELEVKDHYPQGE